MTSLDSDRRDLPPLPQDPPTFGSPVESGGTIGTDTDSYSPRSSSKKVGPTRSRSSKESWIHEEITRTYKKLQYQLQDERGRAEEAERKLVEVTAHLKAVNDARLVAMQEAAQAKEDLKLYKIQLDRAQKEIYRAQETITIVDQQRYAAEEEAAKNRSKARQLNETLVVQAARDEAWRLGLQEGLNQGRNIALATIDPNDIRYNATTAAAANPLLDDDTDDVYSEESRSTERQIRSRQSQFPIRTQSPVSAHSQGRGARSPSVIIPLSPGGATQPNSPRPSTIRPPSTTTLPASEKTKRMPPTSSSSPEVPDQIRPINVRNLAPSSPRILPRSNIPIPDNLIPSLDADSRIRIPAPFEFSRTPEPAAPSELPLDDPSQEALPIPPPEQHHHHDRSSGSKDRPRHRRNSSSGSSGLSGLDIINEPFGGGLRTPMTAIPEVMSQYSGSPLPTRWPDDSEHDMRHHASVNSFQHSSVHQQQPSRSHSPSGSHRISEKTASASGSRHHHHHHRPTSRTSFVTAHKNPSSQELSNSSTPPNIDVQPPSRPTSHRTSHASASPTSRYRVPLPGGSTSGPSRPSSIMTSHTLPGSFTNHHHHHHHPSTPSLAFPQPELHIQIEKKKRRQSTSERELEPVELNSAVSSALTADTLTTPPNMYHRTLSTRGGGDDDGGLHGSRRTSRAGSPLLGRAPVPEATEEVVAPGSPTADTVITATATAFTDDMTGVGAASNLKKTKTKKGKRKT